MTAATRDADPSAKEPEWLHREERGNVFWIRVMTRLSLLAGRRLSRVVLHCIALYFVLAVPKARAASRDYLARVLGRPIRWSDLYRHVLAFASTIHDRIYLLNDRYELFNARVNGVERLHALHSAGKGCFVFGAHLGSFEMLRSIARENGGLDVSAAMYPENARLLNDALIAINPGVMLDVIELGKLEAVLKIHQRLQDGAMVGILADRASGPDKYLPLPFLGDTARFPSGPFRMAAMLRHPVFFMCGLYRGGNRYDIRFELLEEYAVPPAEQREDVVRGLLEKYVAALERYCREAPYNWFNFYDFWNPLYREKD
jgi:predicted LPLAT superfamily acyltransferase